MAHVALMLAARGGDAALPVLLLLDCISLLVALLLQHLGAALPAAEQLAAQSAVLQTVLNRQREQIASRACYEQLRRLYEDVEAAAFDVSSFGIAFDTHRSRRWWRWC